MTQSRQGKRDSGTESSERFTDATLVETTDQEALIKEARRRRRRRVAVIGGSIVLVGALIATVAVLQSSTPPTPSATRSARSTAAAPSAGTIPRTCSPSQLTATVVFNQSGTDLGAIKLTNSSSKACSLSGRPQVSVFSGAGRALATTEVTFARAGLPEKPPGPLVLFADRTLPQGIVELDWYWCGASPGAISFKIQFSKWSSPLVIPNQAVSPAEFMPDVPPVCPKLALFAVDEIRGLTSNGFTAAT